MNKLNAKNVKKNKPMLEFSLTKKQFETLIFENCYYCGGGLSNCISIKYKTGDSFGFIYNGVDRVDNTKGYSLSNSITCCKWCNQAKSDRSVSEFVEWGKTFVDYQHNKDTLSKLSKIPLHY